MDVKDFWTCSVTTPIPRIWNRLFELVPASDVHHNVVVTVFPIVIRADELLNLSVFALIFLKTTLFVCAILLSPLLTKFNWLFNDNHHRY